MLTTMRLRAACWAEGLRGAVFSTVSRLGLSSIPLALRQEKQPHLTLRPRR